MNSLVRGRDRRAKLAGRQLEAGRLGCGDDDGRGTRELDQVGIAHPVRGRDHHLVARAANRHERVVQRVLRPVRDHHLRGLGLQPVMPRVVRRDRLAQARECPPGACSESNRRRSPSTPPAGCFRACRNRARRARNPEPAIPFAFNRRASAPIMSVAEGSIKLERCASAKGTDPPDHRPSISTGLVRAVQVRLRDEILKLP